MARMKNRSDFLETAASGRRWVTPAFVLQMSESKDGAGAEQPAQKSNQTEAGTIPLLGFTVTKKVGNAVIRNRAKRRLREAARLMLEEKLRPGHRYVLIGRHKAVDYPFDKLGKDMRWALAKLEQGADLISKPASRGQGKPARAATEK